MWVQIVVILVVLWVLWFVARQPPSTISALKKIGIVALMIAMIVSVLIPQVTTAAANAIGIGRGADLLLYGLTVAFVVYALTQYTRAQANRRVMYQLGRRLALMDAAERYRGRLGHTSTTSPEAGSSEETHRSIAPISTSDEREGDHP